jgi:hypothetical protein
MGTPRAILKERKAELEVLADVRLPVGEGDGRELPAAVTTSAYHGKKPKKHRQKPETERLYARIREIPLKGVSLKEFCKRIDQAQRPFPIPERWLKDGWPKSWVRAELISKWKDKIHNLRQNAWRNAPNKSV